MVFWENAFINKKIYSNEYFSIVHSWRGGGKEISMNSTISVGSGCDPKLTTVIQDEVILSISIFFRSTCNEDIVISEEVLQACHLDGEIYKVK